MELYSPGNDEEKRLSDRADREHIPLGGVMELLPLCNMNCRMCYVRMSKAEMDAQGKMLTCDEWLRIAEKAEKQGTLFLTLTGGEPLLYPEFKRLYAELKRRGFILSVNTNGTLIDESWADFFAEHGCRRLSITLYGADDATYGDLCCNPKGFTQVMRSAQLLKERNVPFRFTCSLTPHNQAQLERLHEIARSMGVPLSVATYMFPAARRGTSAEEQYRMTPEQAAAATLRNFQLVNPRVPIELAAKNSLMTLLKPPKLRNIKDGFVCHAGRSGFWLNWKGEMTPCGMFNEPKMSLKEHSFAECWAYIVQECTAMAQCEDCRNCPKQNACKVCPANCYTETGSAAGKPEYNCRMTDETIRLCLEYVNGAQKKE